LLFLGGLLGVVAFLLGGRVDGWFVAEPRSTQREVIVKAEAEWWQAETATAVLSDSGWKGREITKGY